MKKIAIALVLAAVVGALAACEDDGRYPYVEIWRDGTTTHKIVIPIGKGFILTKQVYTIEERKDGYDIVIHVKAGYTE